MSTETATPEVAEVDPRLTKITSAWKRVKKLQKDITDQQNCVDEQYARLETAIQDAENAELETVAGNDEFRKRYEHQRSKVLRIRERMNSIKTVFGTLKKKLNEERDNLEDIDRASKESALPLIAATSGKPMSEAWRDTPMTHLSKISKNPLSEKVVEKLVDAGYDTLGKLTDYKSSGSWYTDIDGIGKATSDKIDDAVEQFFAEWNAMAASAPVAEEDSTEEAAVPDLLAKPIAELEGVPEEAVKSLAGEKITTLGELKSKLADMGEDAPLWLDCTVGKPEAEKIRDSIKKLAQAA